MRKEDVFQKVMSGILVTIIVFMLLFLKVKIV